MAVQKALGADAQPTLWVGSQEGPEGRLVERAGIPFATIPSGKLHGMAPQTLPGNLWQMARGVSASRRILREFKPDVLLFTGGFIAAPMALAAIGKPSLVYVPDIEPAWALKFISRFASRICLTVDESQRYFPNDDRVVVTGYPLRPELITENRGASRKKLNLREDLPTLLVMGGSTGARTINQAVIASLPGLLEHCQVIHVTGQIDWPEIQVIPATLPASTAWRYLPFPYLHEEMGSALASADLVISRAGASTLGEYPLFELPAILVPYPHAWRYQKVNAEYLSNQGAAVVLQDEDLSSTLLPTVLKLFGDRERLESMRQAAKALARPNAAERLADQIRELAGEAPKQGGPA